MSREVGAFKECWDGEGGVGAVGLMQIFLVNFRKFPVKAPPTTPLELQKFFFIIFADSRHMQLTQYHLDHIVDTYQIHHESNVSWYTFLESIGITEHATWQRRLLSISDPHLFTLACIRYAW